MPEVCKDDADDENDACGLEYCDDCNDEGDPQFTAGVGAMVPGPCQLTPPEDTDPPAPTELDLEARLRFRMFDSINVEVKSRGPEDGAADFVEAEPEL